MNLSDSLTSENINKALDEALKELKRAETRIKFVLKQNSKSDWQEIMGKCGEIKTCLSNLTSLITDKK